MGVRLLENTSIVNVPPLILRYSPFNIHGLKRDIVINFRFEQRDLWSTIN